MERRTFFVRAGQLVLAGVSITALISCSDDGGDGGTNPGSSTAIAVSIANNHGHSLTLDQSDLTASTAIILTLTNGSGHTHSLDLTGAEVDQLIAGTPVSKASSTDSGHSHTVTLTP